MGASLPNWPVCDECKHTYTIDTYLSDEAWNKIQKYLREAGRGRYMKKLTELEFIPHSEGADECLPF